MLLKDSEIQFLAENALMIDPFVPAKVKGGLSYGLSTTGYDIRLAAEKALEVKSNWMNPEQTVIDPKDPGSIYTEPMHTIVDAKGCRYFLLPPQGVMLGVAVECLKMPTNVMAICMTKSSYARVGVFANITPVEAGWSGYLTMEIKNFNKDCSVKIYAEEGIAQLLFFQTQGIPNQPYDSKYQNQGKEVVFSRA